MPYFKKHATTAGLIGIATLAIANFIKQQNQIKLNPGFEFNWKELLFISAAGGAVGAFAGVLPDILEPATSPHHRNIFHSTTTLTAIIAGLHHVNKSDMSFPEKQIITTAGIGYISHLLLDSETPKGLPLI